jgi:hypothetical protein
MTEHTAALSVVLVTDAYATIEKVVESLRAQTVRDRVELVVVTPARAELEARLAEAADELAAVRVVGIEAIEVLAPGRAAGVRAAAAPIVVVGETHSYPHPGWAEALIDAHAGQWAAVIPGFGNANPDGAVSWAAFLCDYGEWLSGLPPRGLSRIPPHNTAYKRAALLGLGRRLDVLLTIGDELVVRLRAAQGKFAFHPAARVDHTNLSLLRPWLVERYAGGVLVAHHRMAIWSWRRRLAYVLGSPLIPIVLLWRIRHGVAAARREGAVPAVAYPLLAVGMLVRGLGEFIGYAGASADAAEQRMTRYEIHKLRHVRGR